MAMRQGYFRGFTAAEKTELWDRWQRGESLKAIGRAFGKPSSSIYFQLAPHGGIRPAPRRRSRLALTLAEREEISRAIAEYQSTRSIARLLGRSPSTVSREISRNDGYDGYRAAVADAKALDRARRPKRCKLATNSQLGRPIQSELSRHCLPQQIAGSRWRPTSMFTSAIRKARGSVVPMRTPMVCSALEMAHENMEEWRRISLPDVRE
jgi:DNA-binding CsgD family transcriptional regulator